MSRRRLVSRLETEDIATAMLTQGESIWKFASQLLCRLSSALSEDLRVLFTLSGDLGLFTRRRHLKVHAARIKNQSQKSRSVTREIVSVSALSKPVLSVHVLTCTNLWER